MSFFLRPFKKVLNSFNEKSAEEKRQTHQEYTSKVNFTQIYNKNEEYVSVEVNGVEASGSEARVKKFNDLLDARIIDYEKLKELAWDGVPHHLRGRVWRVLLKYLPTNRDTQSIVLERKRKDYRDMVATYMELSGDRSEQKGIDQVTVDVERTLPGSKLFREKKVKELLVRVLYIWSVRHPASGYVQGINDVVTSFAIVFFSEACTINLDTLEVPADFHAISEEQLSQIEADSYWCLSKVLDGLLDNYTNCFPGVKKQFEKVVIALKRLDPELQEHLSSKVSFFYEEVFKWMICLLLRQFSTKIGLRLFDTYVSDDASVWLLCVYLYVAIILKWSLKLKKLQQEEDIIFFLQKIPTTEWKESDLKVSLAEAYVYKTLFENQQTKYN